MGKADMNERKCNHLTKELRCAAGYATTDRGYRKTLARQDLRCGSSTRGTNRPLVAATQPASRLDPIALAAIRAANAIICPTMVDLINLAPLRETVALINSADKLEATIAVINNSDPASKRVEAAREDLARLGLTVARTALMSSGQYATAYDRGKGVIELGQGKASAQLHALWGDLEKFAGRTESRKRNGKATREVRT